MTKLSYANAAAQAVKSDETLSEAELREKQAREIQLQQARELGRRLNALQQQREKEASALSQQRAAEAELRQAAQRQEQAAAAQQQAEPSVRTQVSNPSVEGASASDTSNMNKADNTQASFFGWLNPLNLFWHSSTAPTTPSSAPVSASAAVSAEDEPASPQPALSHKAQRKQKHQAEKKAAATKPPTTNSGWFAWLWSSSTTTANAPAANSAITPESHKDSVMLARRSK